MNNQKEKLHRAIWKIADGLCDNLENSEYRVYVLDTLFYRYISENFTAYINQGEHEAGNLDFDYAELSDEIAMSVKDDLISEKGYFILPSQLFCNVHKYVNENKDLALENLNEVLGNIFLSIERSSQGTESEKDFKGLFDDYDCNSVKLGDSVINRNKTLITLINAIASMQLSDDMQSDDFENFGDAFEYLISQYALNSGKKAEKFYTPHEVSELLTRIATYGKEQVNKVYDPCCGSGSLLLQAGKLLGTDNVLSGFYGQEKDITTYNLCRINMFMHNIGYDKFDIQCGDTLLNPMHLDTGLFDVIVSNPSASQPWEGENNPTLINDPRFAAPGVLAPVKRADYAFVMHILSSLSSVGRAAIVAMPGAMYRGGKEEKIRKYLIDNNYVEAVILLPQKLFFRTGSVPYILVLNKNKETTDTLFIDASDEFVKAVNNNKLSEENISKIVNAFGSKEEIEYFSYLAPYEEICENDYNLTVDYYVEPEDLTEPIDIDELDKLMDETVSQEDEIRSALKSLIAEIKGDTNE